MDQNRRLLDVIDNPQLLQSFLESESSAETNNQQATNATTSPSPTPLHTKPTATSTTDLISLPQTQNETDSYEVNQLQSSANPTPQSIVAPETATNFSEPTPSLNNTSPENTTIGNDGVLDIGIYHQASTTAITTPPRTDSGISPSDYTSTSDDNMSNATSGAPFASNLTENAVLNSIYKPTSDINSDLPLAPISHNTSFSAINGDTTTEAATITADDNTSTNDRITNHDSNLIDANDTNNNDTSIYSVGPSSNLLVDEYYSQPTNTKQDESEESRNLASFSQSLENTSIQERTPDSMNSPCNFPHDEKLMTGNDAHDDKTTTPTQSNSQSEPQLNPESNHLTPQLATESMDQGQLQVAQESNQHQSSVPNFAPPPSTGADLHSASQELPQTIATQSEISPQQSTHLVQPISTIQNNTTESQQPHQIQINFQGAQKVAPPQISTSQANKIMATPIIASTSTTAAPSTPSKAATTSTTTKKSAPRAKQTKNKNVNKDAAKNATSSNSVQQKSTQQTSFMTTPGQQQQIVFQTNNGIRQPTMMAQSPMGQALGGMPQQQRVIQIQTANGPMYFAIAPGPALNNPMMNQQQMNHQPQQQQPMMQSQQQTFPSQQICFQPNSQVMINRPQMAQGGIQHQVQSQQRLQSPQQQQIVGAPGVNVTIGGQQMIPSPHAQPTRLGAPMMAGQTIAIQNSQNSQLPSSQPMMMPRMPNQIILNRPLNSSTPLLPGQQQFIQILTPNGPMLLALPTQSAQQPLNNNNNCNNNRTGNNNNNPTMIDYNNQANHSQGQQPQTSMPSQQQPQPQTMQSTESPKSTQSPTSKSSNSNNSKGASKSSIDLADLLLDCGILPEDRLGSTQSPNSIKATPSPSVQSMQSPMPASIDSTSSLPPNQHTPQPMTNAYPGQPMQQRQPIRITFGPDGQMIMQPQIFGAIRPAMTTPMNQPHLSPIIPNTIVPSSSPLMTFNSNPSTPNSSDTNTETNNGKKPNAKGKGTAVKRSRSKKSDLDKFPILKTPKLTQQQQQQQQQQQTQQQLQAVTVVPMTVIVGDQNKVLGGSDVKPSVAQIASGQQVSLAKIVTPQVLQAASIKQTTVSSGVIQAGTPTTNILSTTPMGLTSIQNTQIVTPESGISINSQSNPATTDGSTVIATTSSSTQPASSTSQINSSGNVTTNLLIHRVTKPGTVESNPHISSSLMPTLSPSVDTLKVEQNGLKTFDGQQQQQQPPQIQTFKAINNANGQLTTYVIHHTSQAQHQQLINQANAQQLANQTQQSQSQQLAHQVDLKSQSILNQLAADQNSAVNPQTKQAFTSIEDACKRLLRYHVYDTSTVSEAQIEKVDNILEAFLGSLLKRKRAIYDKYRLLILKQSMQNIVPSSEEVMLEQVFVNDELSYIKRERELFRDFEAHLESEDQSRSETKLNPIKDDSGQDYFAFGNNSPKQNNQDHLDNAAHSRDVDDWLSSDKWGESRYPTVPDSEAATAIESILNEELS